MFFRGIFVKIITLILSVLVFLILIYFIAPEKFEKFNQVLQSPKKDSSYDNLYKSSVLLSRIWHQGDYADLSSENTCSSFLDLSKLYGHRVFQCNPYFLNCLISESHLFKDIRFKGESFAERFRPVHFHDFPQVQTMGFLVELSDNNKTVEVILPSLCHEVGLPQKKFSLDHKSNKLWDATGREIYVDKFQVSKGDILYSQALLEGVRLPEEMPSDFFEVMANLNRLEMNEYCHSLGKEVLTSHVLDAMSFYYVKIEQEDFERLILPPFPWSKRVDSGFLYEAQGPNEYLPSLDNCTLVYTRECLDDYKKYLYHPLSPTWSGIFQVLGGVPEYVNNLISPRQNIRASSFYFPATSEVHELGKRVYWDGQANEQRNFNWGFYNPKLTDDEDEFKVAFRCMREVL